MRIWNDWLLMDERDTLVFILNYDSIEEVLKHFVDKMNRSFLHYEPDCAFCKDGIPIRQRFIAQILYDGNNLRWEFGADVRRQLQNLEPYVDKTGYIRLTVTRLGKGRKTYYKCAYTRDTHVSRFTSGKYGHLVNY